MDRGKATALLLARAGSVPAGPAGFAAWSDHARRWQLRGAGEWSSGYPVGLRWLAGLRAAGVAAPSDPAVGARAALAALSVGTGPRSVFRAFRGYVGAAPGAVLCADPDAAAAVVLAARSLAADRHPVAGIVPLAEVPAERLRPGLIETSIDAVGPAVGLLALATRISGDPALAELAADQVGWHLRRLVRLDGSVAQYALVDPADGQVVEIRTGPQGLQPDSTWARAQSWGMLAAALAACWLPERRADMLDAADLMASWWAARVPADGIARWDFAAPAGDPLDTSATAIAAAALVRLAALEPGTARGDRHRVAAERAVDALCAHVTTGADGLPAGVLQHGCYHRRAGLATENELVWGTFHALEALLGLAGELDPLAY